VQLFMPGGNGQLGAEGFIMGSLYTTIGVCVSLLTYVAPTFQDKQHQRWFSFAVLGFAVFCYTKVALWLNSPGGLGGRPDRQTSSTSAGSALRCSARRSSGTPRWRFVG
jgi:OST3 / OST6 family, transporter family